MALYKFLGFKVEGSRFAKLQWKLHTSHISRLVISGCSRSAPTQLTTSPFAPAFTLLSRCPNVAKRHSGGERETLLFFMLNPFTNPVLMKKCFVVVLLSDSKNLESFAIYVGSWNLILHAKQWKNYLILLRFE